MFETFRINRMRRKVLRLFSSTVSYAVVHGLTVAEIANKVLSSRDEDGIFTLAYVVAGLVQSRMLRNSLFVTSDARPGIRLEFQNFDAIPDKPFEWDEELTYEKIQVRFFRGPAFTPPVNRWRELWYRMTLPKLLGPYIEVQNDSTDVQVSTYVKYHHPEANTPSA